MVFVNQYHEMGPEVGRSGCLGARVGEDASKPTFPHFKTISGHWRKPMFNPLEGGWKLFVAKGPEAVPTQLAVFELRIQEIFVGQFAEITDVSVLFCSSLSCPSIWGWGCGKTGGYKIPAMGMGVQNIPPTTGPTEMPCGQKWEGGGRLFN